MEQKFLVFKEIKGNPLAIQLALLVTKVFD